MPLPRQPIASTVVSNLVFTNQQTAQLLIDRDEFGTSLYLLTQSASQTESHFSVFVIQPFTLAPSFCELQTFVVGKAMNFSVHFTGQFLAIGFQSCVKIFRFLDGTSAQMEVDIPIMIASVCPIPPTQCPGFIQGISSSYRCSSWNRI
ncbi:hypothetical protein JAAARDRAFT_201309 [Jaapia argillacea MUCL 33604]|uniref:Uncharacterized protein n=1 Tax=Jaapia argillacea MUCL 33604 TaxID=933084 RepID=A0A067PEQ1_9AGAM|nr:hypothetical protein JAAARDRAFT_201309 [Jaapia argillacea MUCL 33604]